MRAGRAAALVCLALLACVAAGPSFGADPATEARIAIVRGSEPAIFLTPAELAKLPVTELTVSFGTEHGPRHASFEGPLLWTVLDHVRAIDPGKPRQQVSQAVQITGRDGYMAVVALGEISPTFEGKQVILAERMDGNPLGPAHLRIVVPGDRRGGRSVRDVVRIAVTAPEPGQH